MFGRQPYRDKVVVVTGATGGLGRALCRAYADRGASVGLLDIEGTDLDGVAADLERTGARCVQHPCDVTDEDQCHAAVDAVIRRLGGVDVLVNNAGIAQRSAFADTSTEVYRRVMDVNFFGSLHCTRAALPALIQRRGQIAVISSVAGFAPLLGRTGYAASKHALRGFFGSLAAELRDVGVGVTMVHPTFIDTGLDRRALGEDGGVTTHPQSRVGQQLTADHVAHEITRATRRRQRTLVLGRVGHVTRMLNAHAPGLYERIMARSLRGELER
jgi:NAD(P)-dependent dehydrogenase (short-subunit alcohol dehydrogenase family)